MIKALVFDLDDTLFDEIDYVHSGFVAVAQFVKNEVGIKNAEKEFIELFENSKNRVFDRWGERLGINNNLIERMTDVYRTHFPKIKLSEEVKQTLLSLKKLGYKLGIITDGRPIAQRNKINSLGLEKLVDEIIVTDELGGISFRKPNPLAFSLMCERLDIGINEMIYVGDNPQKDFAVKKYLPLTTVRLVNNGMYNEQDYLEGILPDQTIDSIDKIIDCFCLNCKETEN